MTSTPRNPEDIPHEDLPDQPPRDDAADSNSDLGHLEPLEHTGQTPVTATAPVPYPSTEHPVSGVDETKKVTRAGMVWTATVAGLIMLVLLIIFIVQNQDQVTLTYFGLSGQVSLGLALFIAAVAGGILAAIAGAVRIIQLRAMARKGRKNGY